MELKIHGVAHHYLPFQLEILDDLHQKESVIMGCNGALDDNIHI